jgi:hypothetical protein
MQAEFFSRELTSKEGGLIMPEAFKPGCKRPSSGPAGAPKEAAEAEVTQKPEMEKKSMVMVGRNAPDFEAPAYLNGNFVNVKLSEYLGKWVVLCFYPGDFTFV